MLYSAKLKLPAIVHSSGGQIADGYGRLTAASKLGLSQSAGSCREEREHLGESKCRIWALTHHVCVCVRALNKCSTGFPERLAGQLGTCDSEGFSAGLVGRNTC